MTLTISIRLPRRAPAAMTPRELLSIALPIAEPAALLLAEAAGAGLVGRIACATALRVARCALDADFGQTSSSSLPRLACSPA